MALRHYNLWRAWKNTDARVGLRQSGTEKLSVEKLHSATDAAKEIAAWKMESTGTAADGLGLYHSFYVDNDADELEEVARMEVSLADVSNGTEDAQFIFKAKVAGTLASKLTIDSSGLTVGDGDDVVLGSTTGTDFGTAVTQKLGFWGVTPVVQPADADQADQGAMTTVGSNTGTAAAGLSLIGDTTSVDQAANLMNDLVALQEDITALDTLLTAMRTALVDAGIMKGSA